MKRVLISIVMLTALAVTACAQGMKHRVVDVGDFRRLALIDDINVNYRCNPDSAGLAVFTCSQDIANRLIFNTNSNGRLSIQVKSDLQQLHNLPTITIYSSSLIEAENAGDSTLRINNLPATDHFKVRLIDNGKIILRKVKANKLELQILSGKGTIIADGKCDELALRLVGAGEIQADDVVATDVSCRIIGTGNMGCNVNGGNLKVNGSGTGKVYYKGHPDKVSVKKLGSIKAIPMD